MVRLTSDWVLRLRGESNNLKRSSAVRDNSRVSVTRREWLRSKEKKKKKNTIIAVIPSVAKTVIIWYRFLFFIFIF